MQYNHLVDTRSLYIHWPFCPYRCTFCPFVALASHDQFMGRYHQALVKEIALFALQKPEKQRLDSIFFGGGTPSTYPDDLLLDTFGILRRHFDFDDTSEVVIEVNPGTVRIEQLPLWRSMGINRISVGVQSLNDAVLKKLNRHQSAQDVHWLLQQATQWFDNVSVDLILGLPGVSENEWKQLIQQVVTWPIKHVSVYFLTIHEHTPLYYQVKKKQVKLTGDDKMVDLYCWTVEQLKSHGFLQYELSNFARPGYESRHNSAYWDRKPYKGFGIGACSFDGQVRLQNDKRLLNYLEGIEAGTDITIFAEELNDSQIYLEKLMLGLRRRGGIALDDLHKHLSATQKEQLNQALHYLEQHGFVQHHNDCWELTLAGLAVENEVVTRLSF